MRVRMDAQRPANELRESESHGRILAIDYGRKRIGLAVSDELGLTARPLENMQRENRQADMRRIREICREHCIRRVVVGQPLHMTGQAGEMAQEAERYAARLRKQLGLPVELLDERLTSWEAKETMEQAGGHSRRREPLDAVAAAVLLRDYLERERSLACAAIPEKD
ncbi:MAG TPA: Holliday junction resolvase RuvX [Candidatus Acidoferrales bacterium]|nr:Holliday junction resolvase RuvX [Candidatus Acidoferrales bacterium]